MDEIACVWKGVSGSRGFDACLVHSFPTPGILGQFYCVVSLMRRVIKRHASSVPRELYDFVVVGGLVPSAARPAGAILKETRAARPGQGRRPPTAFGSSATASRPVNPHDTVTEAISNHSYGLWPPGYGSL